MTDQIPSIQNGQNLKYIRETILNALIALVNSKFPEHGQSIDQLKESLHQLSDSLSTSISTLNSNISQKIAGVHVEDIGNHAFDDINSLHFIGAEVSYDGQQQVTITISPEFSVSNGQSFDSKHVKVTSLEFPGAMLTTRNEGKIAVVAIQPPAPSGGESGGSTTQVGIALSDGSTLLTDVKSITLRGVVSTTGEGNAEVWPGITVKGRHNDISSDEAVYELNAMWPIEVNEASMAGAQKQAGTAVLSIDPRAYEPQHGPSTLLRMDRPLTVPGQVPKSIYFSQQVVPLGEYYSLNQAYSGLNVEDTLPDDPNVTGGQLTEVLAYIAFSGIAPEDGVVKVWAEYKDTSLVIPQEVLEDVSGSPMAWEQSYKQGDTLRPCVLFGAFLAKMTAPLIIHVQTNFVSSELISVDEEKSLLCVNQFGDGYETSLARLEFQNRTGFSMTPSIRKFAGEFFNMAPSLAIPDTPVTMIPALSGDDTLNQFSIQSITPITVQVVGNELEIKDAGTVADYYLDYIGSNTETAMLRGKVINVSVDIANKEMAFRICVFAWKGTPDKTSRVFEKRNSNAVVIPLEGWELVHSVFIPEYPSGIYATQTMSATIPADANNFAVIIHPELIAEPSSLKVKGFYGEVAPFVGFVESGILKTDERHLTNNEEYAEFFTNSQGRAAIRYTIGSKNPYYPMPVGVLEKGKAPITVDHKRNAVAGSMVPYNDGVMVYGVDGLVSQSVTWSVRNEAAHDVDVTFWSVLYGAGDKDGQETEIADSRKTFTIPAGTGAPGILVTIPAFRVPVLAGQALGYRAVGDKDGAYIQTDKLTQYLTQTTIDYKEQVASSNYE